MEFNRRLSARAAALARASRRPRRRTPTLGSSANADNTAEVTWNSREERAFLIWDKVNPEGSSAAMQIAAPADFDMRMPGPGTGMQGLRRGHFFFG